MRKYIRASRDVVMRSDDGLFELVRTQGVGINNTPWTGYEVISRGDADKFVVRIRLDQKWAVYEGVPIVHEYYNVHVDHGMRSVADTLEDTERYIEVLESALDFAIEIYNSDIITPR